MKRREPTHRGTTSRNVYVIDDDPAMLRSAGFLLKSLGYDCSCFSAAGSFLEAVHGLHPGCVITDLRMPEMNGVELLEAMAERSIAWPVVLMTSEAIEGDGQTGQPRFSGFLRKPFHSDDLVAILEACFAKLDAQHS